MKMNKIAVNPAEFVTCRLCFEEFGNYQIIPSLKEQIAYCFGIKVDTYDGLPQLICQKCEEIVSNFSEIKKKFVQKQEELRVNKINNAQESHNEALSSNQQHNEELGSSESPKKPRKRKPGRSLSSSDEKFDTRRSSYNSDKTDVKWPGSYKKQYVCGICNLHWSNIQNLKIHLGRSHGTLYKKYGYIFNRHCQVSLLRTDKKPNITGSKCKVVYDRDKIVKNVNAAYHILYTTKNYKINNYVKKHTSKKDKVQRKSYYSSESSDDDDDVRFKTKRRRRISSSSSNETVILDVKSNVDNDDTETKISKQVAAPACINLDDSSDSDSVENEKTTSDEILPKEINSVKPDYSTINEIIILFQGKYIKKHYQETNSSRSPSDIASKLQHKIFSIGRKIINKRVGVNCTPLLRFMEHKNLDIAWIPREVVNVSNDSNYIRIMPRRKNTIDKSEYNDVGWVDYDTKVVPVTAPTKSSNYNDSEWVDVPILCESNESEPKKHQSDGPEESGIPACAHDVSDQAVLIDGNLTNTEIKKLLNANPVANPKQLPKKFANIEIKLSKKTSNPGKDTHQEDDTYMPIITSTTSLAPSTTVHENDDISNTNTTHKQQPEPPRIKVKPVSELMSVETLSRMHSPGQTSEQNLVTDPMQNLITPSTHYLVATPMKNVVSTSVQNIITNSVQNFVPTSVQLPMSLLGKGLPLPVQNVTVPVILSSQNVNQNMISKFNKDANLGLEPVWQNEEFMILDTVELPNTRTNSPYLYLKKLLQLHNITLLDSFVELSQDFHCLIKFKVLYKQDVKNEPVTLCLALFCSNNVFCFKVKDRNNDNLDITKISPNWQWEVLKIYKGEVVNKLLNNAKKISQEIFEFTNSFLCLLKSIKMKRP